MHNKFQMCSEFVNIPLKATVSLKWSPLYIELLACGWCLIVLPVNLTGSKHRSQLPCIYGLTSQMFCQQAKDGRLLLKCLLFSVVCLTQGWAEWRCPTAGSLGAATWTGNCNSVADVTAGQWHFPAALSGSDAWTRTVQNRKSGGISLLLWTCTKNSLSLDSEVTMFRWKISDCLSLTFLSLRLFPPESSGSHTRDNSSQIFHTVVAWEGTATNAGRTCRSGKNSLCQGRSGQSLWGLHSVLRASQLLHNVCSSAK